MLRTRPVPQQLATWLDIANDVSEGRLRTAITELGSAYGTFGYLLEPVAPANRAQERLHIAQTFFAEWSPTTVRFLLPEDDTFDPALTARARLTMLPDIRKFFETIANASAHTQDEWVPLPPGQMAFLRIESGRLKIKLAPFLIELQGLEAERIRKCSRCGSFFWAGRLNKTACSEECSRVLRQQKYRDNRKYKKTRKKRRA